MTKTQLAAHMVGHFRRRGRPLHRDDAREFLAELQRVCLREMQDHGQFRISGIAKLVLERRPARMVRDPVTGGRLRIPARLVVRARVSSVVRKAVEQPITGRASAPPSPRTP